MPRFYLTRDYLPRAIAPYARNVDWTPTLHYYATLELDVDHGDEWAAANGLVPCTDELEADEAEAQRTYRAETRGAA